MKLGLDLQRRNPKTGKVVVTRKKFDPHKLGVVVIDLWNWHWCKTASKRAAAMVPRMNRALECLRPLGVQVLLCPTDVADSYAGTPQRERAVAAPVHPMPKPRKLDWPAPRGSKLISIAATDGGDGNRLDHGNIVNCGFVLKTRPSPSRRRRP